MFRPLHYVLYFRYKKRNLPGTMSPKKCYFKTITSSKPEEASQNHVESDDCDDDIEFLGAFPCNQNYNDSNHDKAEKNGQHNSNTAKAGRDKIIKVFGIECSNSYNKSLESRNKLNNELSICLADTETLHPDNAESNRSDQVSIDKGDIPQTNLATTNDKNHSELAVNINQQDKLVKLSENRNYNKIPNVGAINNTNIENSKSLGKINHESKSIRVFVDSNGSKILQLPNKVNNFGTESVIKIPSLEPITKEDGQIKPNNRVCVIGKHNGAKGIAHPQDNNNKELSDTHCKVAAEPIENTPSNYNNEKQKSKSVETQTDIYGCSSLNSMYCVLNKSKCNYISLL